MVRERTWKRKKNEKGRCGAVLIEKREEEIWAVYGERWRSVKNGGRGLGVVSHSKNLGRSNEREVHFVSARKEWKATLILCQ
ncbi:unnamed protein product [Sphenostylis stenocarpa]|uniref:Uncharacterized protein n=1 Tax=Sphenostylis stenocarpa TaxID=92480 RepID=A0AA86W0I4_9FABA|nr:unnamed protein product [Sphenostylis stenocarpa]